MNALYSAFSILLEPGDEVLLPTPGFPNMDEMVRLLGGVPRWYHLRPSNGFLPDLDELAAQVTPRTKVMFVNSPSNPTGRVYGEATVRDVVAFAQRHDLWLISDEVYDELVLDSVGHPRAVGLVRHRRTGDLGVQLLEGLRDDRLAGGLRRRAR